MKWNPFKKKDDQSKPESDKLPDLPGVPKMEDMNMFQRFAMKRFLAMKPADREKVIKKSLTPENVAKHRDEIIASLETMRKAGQISDDQYRLAKKRFGLK